MSIVKGKKEIFTSRNIYIISVSTCGIIFFSISINYNFLLFSYKGFSYNDSKIKILVSITTKCKIGAILNYLLNYLFYQKNEPFHGPFHEVDLILF